MGRIDAIWLATEPIDVRADTETALARVVEVFGAAKPHCACVFANRRATRTHTADQGISVIEWGLPERKCVLTRVHLERNTQSVNFTQKRSIRSIR